MSENPTRRHFLGRAGALLAAPLAGTASAANAPNDAAARLVELEDARAIHALLSELLANPQRLALGDTISSIAADRDEIIAVAADGTATAVVGCSVETATPIEGHGSVVEMAKLQGDGVVRRRERRTLESAFVKRNGIWQLARTELIA